MHPRERTIIYALLGLILVVNGIILLGRGGTPAMADAATTQLDTLGPTDGVVLSGDPVITLRNASGNPAWTDNAHGRSYSIGLVDLTDILTRLLETDRYLAERERLSEQIQDEEQEWRRREQQFMEQHGNITQDDPRLPDIQAEYSELVAQYQEWQNRANQRVNTMAVEQLKRGYGEVVSAVDVVSDRLGIDLVFKFTPTAEELAEGISGNTMLDIRMRPLVRYPDAINITDAVLAEMALPLD